MDLVISTNEIYASVLLKCIRIDNKIYSQINAGEKLKEIQNKEYSIEIKHNLEVKESNICFCERILPIALKEDLANKEQKTNSLELACYWEDLIPPNHPSTALGKYKVLYKREKIS